MLPFQIVICMIPVAWLSGHFRFTLIVSGHQRLEFLASALAGVTTLVLALAGASRYGAPGAAAALLIGGVINAIAAGIAMRRVVGAVRLSPAAPALIACLASLLAGFTASWLAGRMSGAVLACLLYAGVAASQWDFAGLRRAWEGRSG